MTDHLFPPRPQPLLATAGGGTAYPVARIFCVGRNYADHAAEMGAEVDREAPFYFTKSCHHLLGAGADLPYPPGTADLHHEVELVAAIGAPAVRVTAADALAAVWGYAVGLDMTRRDLQAEAKAKRRPWDIAKDFEGCAIIGPLRPAAGWGPPGAQIMRLSVNGAPRQETRLAAMVWSLPDIIAHLSTLYRLGPGDLIMTGTPAGVGPVAPGDLIEAGIEGLPPLSLRIAPPL
jgi:fumarylpyruvate hydrolase